MASPPPVARASTLRRGSFALQDDPYALGVSYKGQGALSSLIQRRSAVSLLGYGERDEEHGGAGDSTMYARLSEDSADERRRVDERRRSSVLLDPQVRSMRLIGHSNPRYRWERYWKTDAELGAMKKQKLRDYYMRNNYLIQQYLYIDRLLDSSLPHDLLNDYNDMPASAFRGVEVPATICEEPPTPTASSVTSVPGAHNGSPPSLPSADSTTGGATINTARRIKRTPRDIYRPSETTPLFAGGNVGNENEEDSDDAAADETGSSPYPEIPSLEDDDIDSSSRIVTLAIYVNLVANAILLAGKAAVIVTVPSVSVLASLVDAVLDFLSTGIVWTTTWLISHQDQYRYPVGRRRLEPLGVLVFAVIMITSFVQVGLEAIQRLASPDHTIIELGIPAMSIMLGTIVVKGAVWVWLRLVKNSSVQALAADAVTDVVFNAGSIAFPIVGFYAKIWWLDALGGLLLSLVVIFNWSQSANEHIQHLCGFSATADQRNILLYLTMRFAKTIKQIQGLQAYHAGDKLNVEVDIVLDASTSLKDSHDLSESLQYVLESVPIVDRAFVHVDYAGYNLPTHMEQQC